MYKRCGWKVYTVPVNRAAYRVLYTGMLTYNEVILITVWAI